MLLGVAEHFANQASALPDVLVHNRAGDNLRNEGRCCVRLIFDTSKRRARRGVSDCLEEGGLDVASDRSCQKGLACSRRAKEQNSLGWLDSHAHKEVGVDQGELHDLADLPNLIP